MSINNISFNIVTDGNSTVSNNIIIVDGENNARLFTVSVEPEYTSFTKSVIVKNSRQQTFLIPIENNSFTLADTVLTSGQLCLQFQLSNGNQLIKDNTVFKISVKNSLSIEDTLENVPSLSTLVQEHMSDTTLHIETPPKDGNAGKMLVVNQTEDGFTYATASGTGDMITTVYDTNNDGIVNKADKSTALDDGITTLTPTQIQTSINTLNNHNHDSRYLQDAPSNANQYVRKNGAWSLLPNGFSGNYAELTNVPTTFTPSTHTHNADDVTQTTTKRFVTDAEKATWNNKSNFSGSYSDLTNKPVIPTDTNQLIKTDVYTKTEINTALTSKANTTHTHNTSDITTDSTHRFVTDAEKTTWNGKADSAHTHAEYLQDAPADSQEYIRKNGAWQVTTGGSGGIGDAPIDGNKYVRQDGAWTTLPTSTGFSGDYNDLTNKPTIPTDTNQLIKTDVYTKTEVNTALTSKANTTHSHTASDVIQDATHRFITDIERTNWDAKSNFSGVYADLTGKPTIPTDTSQLVKTDVYTKTEINTALTGKADSTHSHASTDITQDTTHRFITDAERTSWNAKSNFSGSYTDLTNKPTIPTDTNQLIKTDVYTKTEVNTSLATKANSTHSHAISDITNLQTTLDGKSSTAHTHAGTYEPVLPSKTGNANKLLAVNATADGFTYVAVSGGGDMLKSTYDSTANGKVDKAEQLDDGTTTLTPTQIQTSINGKANATHTHAIADVTNLQTSLDSKASTSHTHNSITDSNATTGVTAIKMWTGTQAEYTAIATKDTSTLYLIKG